MKYLAAALLATTTLAATANADVIRASFSGTVSDQQGTSYTVGAPIIGSFTYDTTAGTYSAFNIGTFSVTAPFDSFGPLIAPGVSQAVFKAQQNPSTAAGITTSAAFTVDLEYNSKVSTLDLSALLNAGGGAFITDPTDPGVSTFGWQTQSANGTGVRFVDAFLTNIAAPEPITLALLGTAGVSLLAARRRR